MELGQDACCRFGKSVSCSEPPLSKLMIRPKR